jgi:Endoribonuclease XendoU
VVRRTRGRSGHDLSAHLGRRPVRQRHSRDCHGRGRRPGAWLRQGRQRGGRDPEHRLFAEVQIPAHKRRTYDLCQALFDNYRLDQSKPEDNQSAEAREILALIEAVADSAPMVAARAHLEARNGASYSSDAWQELIFELWFRQFDDGRNLDLSAFEHVVVGEQKGGEVNGHHFWYILRKSAQNG